MGFSPLKLQNPHKTWKELSTAGALSRAAKDGAQQVTRGVKAAALFLPNLKKQVLRGDPSKPVRWIDDSRKTQRENERRAARNPAAPEARTDAWVRAGAMAGSRVDVKLQLAGARAGAPAPAAPLATPNDAAQVPAQAQAIERVDAALKTYHEVLRGNKRKSFDGSDFDRVALMALRRLRDDKGLSEKDFARFAGAGEGFSTESAADRDKRFSPFGGEADPVRRLCEATIGEAWRRMLQGQWGQQGEQAPIGSDVVAAWVQAHPAAPGKAPVEGAPGAGGSLGKDIEDGAKQVYQQLLNLKDRLLGGEQGGASDAPTQDGTGSTQEAPVEEVLPAVVALDDLKSGSSKAAVQPGTLMDAIQQAVQDLVGRSAHPEPTEPTRSPDAPVPLAAEKPVVEAVQTPVKEPVKFTREEKLAQVDKAWAAYGTVLGGEVPEGAKTSLDAETLQRLAGNAMLQLHDAGWITQTDVDRFNAPDRFITRETKDERAQRFIPGDAPNRAAARQLCEVAIGQAWARAYGADGDGAPADPFTIGEWRKRGAPAQAIAPTPLS